jgi:hypothetical protein
MNINTVFPSKYLRASDLQGREITVTISHLTMEEFDGDPKPVAYFVGKEKGVALNKTNSTNIASAYGPETDDWQGKSVILYPAWVDFQGKSVEAIRIRPNPSGRTAAPPPPPPSTDGLDDSIPF